MRYNFTLHVGYVPNPLEIGEGVDKDGKEFSYARGPILTLASKTPIRTSKNGAKQTLVSALPLYTQEPELVKKMKEIRPGDIIMVRGMVCSKDKTKAKPCPICGKLLKKEGGSVIYIHPLEVNILRHGVEKNEAREALLPFLETSNYCMVSGNVCIAPEELKTGRKKSVVKFGMVVPRKYYIISEPDTEVDFVHVHCYGDLRDVAKRCHTKLEDAPSTTVSVEGKLRVRKMVDEMFPCDKEEDGEPCMGFIHWVDYTVDIIPYALELENNAYTEDWLKEQKLNEAKERVNEIRGRK